MLNLKELKSEDCYSTANKAGQKIREGIKKAENEIKNTKETVIEEIRSKPIRSSLIAAGVGFILGVLAKRR